MFWLMDSGDPESKYSDALPLFWCFSFQSNSEVSNTFGNWDPNWGALQDQGGDQRSSSGSTAESFLPEGNVGRFTQ